MTQVLVFLELVKEELDNAISIESFQAFLSGQPVRITDNGSFSSS
jgi:hypothetical protein